MKVMTVLGTRPEIIRLSRLIPKLDALCSHVLVHTGQNFDPALSDVFFRELGVRPPDISLGVRAESFGEQAGQIFTGVERAMRNERPDRLLILGDTNSGLSAVVAKRLGVPVYHMEAGNRCFDDRVPEEVNRRIIDHSSDVLLPYTERSRANLLREGIAVQRVIVTGNPILEVIRHYERCIDASDVHTRLGVQRGAYFLVTAHRAENVDVPERLRQLAEALARVGAEHDVPIVVSMHPRTRSRLEAFGMTDLVAGLRVLPPLGFFDFLALERDAACVLTDSGTVQEECCILHVANVTTRDVTAETVLALAPDPASAKAGRDLAVRRKWTTLGVSRTSDGAPVLWGACQGSGKDPYLTRADTSEPAFKCSCPSRKFPCKHSLGLFLLFVQSPAEFATSAPPDWVAEWLESRSERAAKRAEREARAADADGEGIPADPAQAEKAAKQAATRVAERERRVAAGITELDLWLRDLIRQGLSTAATRPVSSWETMAARLVDAQAPGAARLVRQMATIPASGDGWPERLLDRMARLHLLLEGYSRIDSLPPELAADVRTGLGWTTAQETLLELEGVRDHWAIVGRRVTDDDRLRVQRTWLWGKETGRGALLLHFAPAGVVRSETKPIDPTFVPGTAFDGRLVFFPSAAPLRAIVKERTAAVEWPSRIGYADISDAVTATAGADARTPWLEGHPVLLREAVPTTLTPAQVRDTTGRVMPLSARFRDRWRLLAVSGGLPVPLFGEWDGETFMPLTVWGEGGAVALA